MTKHADQAGADGTFHVTGYYNKPTQKGSFSIFLPSPERTSPSFSIPFRVAASSHRRPRLNDCSEARQHSAYRESEEVSRR